MKAKANLKKQHTPRGTQDNGDPDNLPVESEDESDNGLCPDPLLSLAASVTHSIKCFLSLEAY